MGQIMKLGTLVERLDEFDDGDAIYLIYASEPWTEDSDAMVVLAPESDEESVPDHEAIAAGMTGLIEVFIAREVVEGWTKALGGKQTTAATCRRIIEYAINDA